MAIVREGFADGPGSGSTAVFVSVPSWAAGNTCLINVRWYGTVTISSITMDGESNPTLLGSPQTGGPNNARSQWALLSNVTGTGTKEIDVTLSGSPDQAVMCAWRLSGCDTSGAEDARNGASGTSAAPSVSVTTTQSGSAIFAVVSNDNGEATAGGAYTSETLINGFQYDSGEYDIDAGTAGSKTVDFSLGGSGTWVINAIAIKAAGGGSDVEDALSGSAVTSNAGTSPPGISVGI
jgi:hypothetical protein